MTRKDYVLIAAALKASELIHASDAVSVPTALKAAHKNAVLNVAQALARDNWRFDHSRFLEASGVPQSLTDELTKAVQS